MLASSPGGYAAVSPALDPPPVHPRHLLVASAPDAAGDQALAVARALLPRLHARLTPLLVRLPAAHAARGGALPAAEPEVPPPLAAGAAVVEGIPGIEITRYAESHGADLIVLSREPGEGSGPPGLGSTWEAVVRRAEVPCLVLPACQERLARMLVALDGSERGMVALRLAIKYRRLSGDGISAIHVEPEDPSGRDFASVPSARSLQLRQALSEGPLRRHPIPLIERRGDPVAQVLSGLSAAGGDLLVVGVRRGGAAETSESTGTGRRLLGAAPCAVLTVPL